METAEHLISEIDTYLLAQGVSASAFGRAAVGDPNLVSDLKSGRMPNLRTLGRIRHYIESNPVPAPHPERAA